MGGSRVREQNIAMLRVCLIVSMILLASASDDNAAIPEAKDQQLLQTESKTDSKFISPFVNPYVLSPLFYFGAGLAAPYFSQAMGMGGGYAPAAGAATTPMMSMQQMAPPMQQM